MELGSLQLGFGMVNRILIKREVLAEGALKEQANSSTLPSSVQSTYTDPPLAYCLLRLP